VFETRNSKNDIDLMSSHLFIVDVNQSIPLVPWNKQQESGLQTEAFILLLHKLGFLLAADVGKCFPRIPHFWSADHVLQMATKLGPIDTSRLSFDVSQFLQANSGKTITVPLMTVNQFIFSRKSVIVWIYFY